MQRVSSYYDGMPMADVSAMPRAASRSGSRADFGPPPMTPQQQQQQPPLQFQLPLSPSRGGWANAGPGGMWSGQNGPVPMNTLFGSGFGTMGMGHVPTGVGFSGAMSPATPYFPGGPAQMGGPASRPGSSLQQAYPARPATSTGFHGSGHEGDGPVLVNVARGGARVIGPMRAKPAAPEGPAFLNPIPQSPSSAIDGVLPGAPYDAGAGREGIRSVLSHRSIESGRSRSNSALRPIEESMEAAEARVSRKIQDLKITNESLLVVNAQLESRVKSQGQLISDLRKQLQRKVPFAPDSAVDSEISDEALRSAMKEDKVFERLISNLEHLIQDTKAALEYRSTVAAGKVISAAELNEDGSQMTAGAAHGQDSAAADDGPDQPLSSSDSGSEDDGNDDDSGNDEGADNENASDGDGPAEDAKAKTETNDSAEAASARQQQEARELVARLMVLALSSPDPASQEKPPSRIPKQTPAAGAARVQGAPKIGVRTPVKSASSRISSFGVASANTPVRSVGVSPTPSSKPSPDSNKDAAHPASDKEQILDICRRLQQIL
ncbi:hypothetical protein H4R19_002236 [Coemansia spiralis]|nr:hypothetical protein H4R19_002236 [Coemansia spiralis]